MMIKRLVFFLGLTIALSAQTEAESIHSGSIIKDTFAALPNCLHYQPSGHFCIWMSELGEVNTTPIVSHYLPDLVVSVFAKPQDNPWVEVSTMIDKPAQSIQNEIISKIMQMDSGSGNHSLLDQHEQNVIFKEVDVIGNPALAMIPSHGLLPSTAKSFQIYFQSMSDSLLWRGFPPAALTEESTALALNAVHHVGMGITNWGGIFPHEGKVASDNDVKASAVLASRAGDLITSHDGYGHIYKYLLTSCGEHCTATAIQENSKQACFQMIYPITQNDCHVLGSIDSFTPNMINQEGAYIWIIWRYYEGCAEGNGRYLGSY